MWSSTHQYQLGNQNQTLLMMLVLFLSFFVPLNANFSRKLDETLLVPESHNSDVKCTVCPCANPCDHQLPPPPPPPPPSPPPPPNFQISQPPPPRFIYFTGPPPPRFYYFSGQPGNLYPADPYGMDIYSGAGWNVVSLIVLFGCGLLLLLAFLSL
ncbi:hypothetical protein LOK49_LG01G03033 [Camellia lanceoleosa]|uniref:Uncharacterized protein n=1 Tax=Camellia lanceoleosa TaxID=1840588 RepID=A0ACC0IXU3_9ERIC|nr:hypothetical protein LOK49_LG01G03033 [Camellia lanceoleosa]